MKKLGLDVAKDLFSLSRLGAYNNMLLHTKAASPPTSVGREICIIYALAKGDVSLSRERWLIEAEVSAIRRERALCANGKACLEQKSNLGP